jgi:hypothetical protein
LVAQYESKISPSKPKVDRFFKKKFEFSYLGGMNYPAPSSGVSVMPAYAGIQYSGFRRNDDASVGVDPTTNKGPAAINLAFSFHRTDKD